MATHAPITGAPTRAPSNVSALPTAARRKPPHRQLTGTQLEKLGIKRILPEYVDPREGYSVAMILVEAILAQMTPEQRGAAKDAVHLLHHQIGTEQSRAASAFIVGVR